MNAGGPLASAASPLKLVILALAAVAAVAGLASLGVWQLQRLAWKEDLIRRVDEHVHAQPVSAPGPAQWSSVNAANSEYLNVRVQGHYLHDRETLVQAVTIRGGGFWVLTPLQTPDGFIVMVNRGFVLPQNKDPQTRLAAQFAGLVTVTGLLRLNEPGGGFLRSNDSAAGRWYSRDIGAIASAKGLSDVAPYFIDAEQGASVIPNAPEGGLTVISFANDHLEYALTWFGLALMTAVGTALVFRHEWRIRKQAAS